MDTLSDFEEIFVSYATKGQKPSAKDSMMGFKELKIIEENPFEIVEEFISGEISDFEAYLEAIKTQNDYFEVKK